MTNPKRTPKTKLVSAEEAKRRHDVIDRAILKFEGQLDELEGAAFNSVAAR